MGFASNGHQPVPAGAPLRRIGRPTRSQTATAAFVVLLALTYLAPRLAGLDRLVTVDEGRWLGRSANFYEAMASGDFASTYQFAHPGVPTMWAGAIAYLVVFPEYASAYSHQIDYVLDVHRVIRDLGRDPLTLLVAGRVVKLLMQTAFLALGFWLVRPVFGTPITVVGTLLLAFDPFLIGHDRLLHVDSLFATTAFVSLLALLRALGSGLAARYLVLSAVFAALAWLTRTPGLVLTAVVAVSLLVHAWRRRAGMSPIWVMWMVVRPFAVWVGAATATTVAVWPALWVSPVTVARRMFSWSLAAASDGHEYATFFYGPVADGDPGLVFYPVTLLWRLTPFTLTGLLLVGLGLGLRARAVVPRALVGPVALLAGFALLYLAGMSLGAKKFDRYILPVYPALDLLAAVGIVGLARWIGRRTQDSGLSLRSLSQPGERRPTPPRTRPLVLTPQWFVGPAVRRVLVGVAVGAVVLGQLASALTAAPYYLPYFNPLLGGVGGAERALLLGWGEGLDQVAGYILSQPDGAQATIRGSNQRNTLLYHLPPTVTIPPSQFHSGMAGIVEWAETDYFVAYVTQGQRELSRSNAYVAAYPPVHTVTFDDTTFARTYDLRTIPPPVWMLDNHCAFAFRDDVQLVAYQDESIGVPGVNYRTLTLHFASLPAAGTHYTVRIDLLPLDPGLEPMSTTTELLPAEQTNQLSKVDVTFRFPRKRTLNSYSLLVTVLDPATGEPMPATRVSDGIDRPRALVPRCD